MDCKQVLSCFSLKTAEYQCSGAALPKDKDSTQLWKLLTGTLLQVSDDLPLSSPAASPLTVIWLMRLRLIIAQLLLKALLQEGQREKPCWTQRQELGCRSALIHSSDQIPPSTVLRVEGTRNSRNQPRLIHIFIRKSTSQVS